MRGTPKPDPLKKPPPLRIETPAILEEPEFEEEEEKGGNLKGQESVQSHRMNQNTFDWMHDIEKIES